LFNFAVKSKEDLMKQASLKKVKNINDNALTLAKVAVAGCEEKKANDIVCLDLRNLGNAVADFFIICHADSKTQVEAIYRSVEDEVEKLMDESPYHKEGLTNAEWILLDYSNVVVHIFQTEKRNFFGLENLWADAEVVKF
jgi:ribosome-associated protein